MFYSIAVTVITHRILLQQVGSTLVEVRASVDRRWVLLEIELVPHNHHRFLIITLTQP